jgi:hypothetical protein
MTAYSASIPTIAARGSRRIPGSYSTSAIRLIVWRIVQEVFDALVGMERQAIGQPGSGHTRLPCRTGPR